LHELIDKEVSEWPDIRPETIGLSPNLIAFDRGLHIVRCEHNKNASDSNRGLLKKDLVMETTGGLGVQQGLRKFTLSIYLKTRNTPKHILNDATRSFHDHLPHSLGAFIAYRLHWLIAMRLVPESEALQSTLFQNLDFKISEDDPIHLQQTYNFLKEHPQKLMKLVVVLEFCMLVSFLSNPNGAVSLGLREGNLSLRLLMDPNQSVYFQRQLHPKQTLAKIQSILPELTPEQPLRHLIDAYFGFLHLRQRALSIDDQSGRVLNEYGCDPQAFVDLWANIAHGTSLPIYHLPNVTSPIKQAPSAQPKTAMNELIKDRKWKVVYERLLRRMNIGLPENRMGEWGAYLWALIESWHDQLKIQRPGNGEVEDLRKLLDFYARGLTLSGSIERCEKLVTLMQKVLREGQLFNFLMEQKQTQKGPLTEPHIDMLLTSMIPTCYDSARLLDLHRHYPEHVLEHVIGRLCGKPIPNPAELTQFVHFLKQVDRSKLKELAPLITRRLIKKLRAQEAHQQGWLTENLRFFEEIFEKANSKGDLSFASDLLNQWKRFENQPSLAEKEFIIIRQCAIKDPCVNNINKVIHFASCHQRDSVWSDRSVSLCLELIGLPDRTGHENIIHLQISSVQAIWRTIKPKIEQTPNIITRNHLIFLISQLKRSKSYAESWEYLHFVLTKTDFWNSLEDDLLNDVIHATWDQRNNLAYQAARTHTIATAFDLLNNKTNLIKDPLTHEGFAVLFMCNLVKTIKDHNDPEVSRQLWHSAYRLLFRIHRINALFFTNVVFDLVEEGLNRHGLKQNWKRATRYKPRTMAIFSRTYDALLVILPMYIILNLVIYITSITDNEG
jgi:hypothetical protein